jgi:hypothetical protein
MNVPAVPAPRVHNSFAIPSLTKRSGATQAKLHHGADLPLNPWTVCGHEDLYAAVDDTEGRYQEFKRRLPEVDVLLNMLDNNPGPPVVVVSGGSKSGKTSLINRCANHLAETLASTVSGWTNQDERRWVQKTWTKDISFLTIADISRRGTIAGGGSRELMTEAIGQYIFQEIIKRLEFLGTFSPGVIPNGSLDTRFTRLSSLLLNRQHHVLVLLPKEPRRGTEVYEALLEACLRYRLPGIVMFLECSESEAELKLSREVWAEEPRVIYLEIGSLNDTDCARFVDVRISGDLWDGPYVDVAPDAYDACDRAIPYKGVGELQKTFHDLAERLVVRGETSITLELLCGYREEVRKREASDRKRPPRGRS